MNIGVCVWIEFEMCVWWVVNSITWMSLCLCGGFIRRWHTVHDDESEVNWTEWCGGRHLRTEVLKHKGDRSTEAQRRLPQRC